MDLYEIWFDLIDRSQDMQFTQILEKYMHFLANDGLIEGYRLSRRKLGFGPAGMGEFHVTIETRDLAQLDQAFQRAASRDVEVESLHSAVYSSVKNATFGLYRDFPDAVRIVERQPELKMI